MSIFTQITNTKHVRKILFFFFLPAFLISSPKAAESSRDLTMSKVWQIVNTCIISEFSSSTMNHMYYRGWYTYDSHLGGLNKPLIQPPTSQNETANITLFLHGTGGHPASFIPIAETLTKNGVSDLYTAFLTPSTEDPLSLESILEKMNELETLYQENGYEQVTFNLVGHSLGAIAASYVALCVENSPNIEKVISLGGRLKYIPGGDFDWFCQSEKPFIEELYSAYEKNPSLPIYTIIGSNDEIVPRESAHISPDESHNLTVEGWGHGGILFAPETMAQINQWILSS